MANSLIWTGTSTFTPGQTPFGFYDNDIDFQLEADKVARFCSQRLGYPLVDVELQSGSFYTAFEEAITIYGNELYAFKIRDNQLSLEGSSTELPLNNAIISPSFEPIVRLTKKYGTEAGSGGNIDWYQGSIAVSSSQQTYDLEAWAIDQGITGSIEIKRVFYQSPPAIVRYYDPYSGTGFGYQSLFDSFGFGAMSPAINYLMMPLNYDMATIQAIEMNDKIRRSNYSFELINNKLKLFPIPSVSSGSLYFEYIKTEDRLASSIDLVGSGSISNVSNAPFENPVYSEINSVGRKWIYEYTLAISKEMLGLVRGKYSNIPIPNAEVTLNQSDLLTQAANEKVALIERLRGYFDETSRQSLLERKAQESEYVNQELKNVPFTIYIA